MESQQHIGIQYQKAGFWKRLLAFFIDECIVASLALVCFIFIDVTSSEWVNILGFLGHVLYNSTFLIYTGQTIGKKILHLRVVSTDYSSASIKQILLRETIGRIYSGMIACFGYVVILKNPNRQSWHDILAKTYVLQLDSKNQMVSVQKEEVSKRDKVFFWILAFISFTPIWLSIFVVIYLFIGSPIQINGHSMAPNYMDGEYYFTDKSSIRNGNIKRGDVVVFVTPNNQRKEYFKRVIGLPGESLAIIDGRIVINGNTLDEPYTMEEKTSVFFEGSLIREREKIRIPDDGYFVLGDNRGHSYDSRQFGTVPGKNIISKVTFCYWNCSKKQ